MASLMHQISPPKTARKDRPNTFRVDLSEADSAGQLNPRLLIQSQGLYARAERAERAKPQRAISPTGVTKYVLATDDEAGKARWQAAFAAADHTKQFAHGQTKLRSMRQSVTPTQTPQHVPVRLRWPALTVHGLTFHGLTFHGGAWEQVSEGAGKAVHAPMMLTPAGKSEAELKEAVTKPISRLAPWVTRPPVM